jgi:hypothetical protein
MSRPRPRRCVVASVRLLNRGTSPIRPLGRVDDRAGARIPARSPSPLVRLRHQRPSPSLSVGRSLIGRAAFGIPHRLRRSHIFARGGAAYTRTEYLPDG